MAKVLYTFTIKKEAEIEEEKTETIKNEAGEDVTRTYKEKIKKEVPVEIKINQPSRRQMQEADTQFSIEMSKCIKQGILTKAMLLNKYSDTGGLISDSDAKSMVEAADEIAELQAKLTILNLKPSSEKTEEDSLEAENLTSSILKRRKTLMEKETSYINLFNHTADVKAQNKSILWYILNLTFVKDNSKRNADFEPLFPGKSFEEREAIMFDYEDEANEIYSSSYAKLAGVVSYWFFTGESDTEEFDRIIKEVDESKQKSGS